MSNTYVVGDLVRVSCVFTTQGGAFIDPSTVTVTILYPDGTTTTPSVTRDSVGNYHSDVSATQSGRWRYRWAATGTGQSAVEGVYTVNASQVI